MDPPDGATFYAAGRLEGAGADDDARGRGATGRLTTTSRIAAKSAVQDGYRTLFEKYFHPTVRLERLLGADNPEDTAREAFVRLHRHPPRDPAAALA